MANKKSVYLVMQKGVPTQKVSGKNLQNWAESYYSDNKQFYKNNKPSVTSDVYKTQKNAKSYLEKDWGWKITKLN